MSKSTIKDIFLTLILNSMMWIAAIVCCAYMLDGDKLMGPVLLVLALNAGGSLFLFAALIFQKANRATGDHEA